MRNFFYSALLMVGFTMGIAFAEPININTATVQEITANLKGVGEVKAQALVDYRTENGPFKTEQDILKVKGIGEKILETIRDDLLKDSQEKEQLAQ